MAEAGEAEEEGGFGWRVVGIDEGEVEEEQDEDEWLGEVGGHGDEAVEAGGEGVVGGGEDGAAKFKEALERAFGPAGLLAFVGEGAGGEFGGGGDIVEELDLPAVEDGAGAEAEVFADGIIFPAAAIIDALAAPDAGGAVEFGEEVGAVADVLFHGEMFVHGDGLGGGEEGVVGVEVGPTGLDEAEVRPLLKVGDGATEEIGLGLEVGIEDGDEFTGGVFEGIGEGAGFVAVAVGTAVMVDIDAVALVVGD